MKKSIIILAALATAVACEKSAIEEAPVKGIPVTLTASIGDPATRLTYTQATNTSPFKAVWNTGDQVTLMTLNSSDEVLTFDNLTFSGADGASSGTFTGTFTGDAANKLVVMYPPVTKQDDNTYASAPVGEESKSIMTISKTSGTTFPYFTPELTPYTVLQTAPGDLSHIAKATIMLSDGDVSVSSEGKLSATLKLLTSVFAVGVKFPKAQNLNIINTLAIYGYKSDGTDYQFCNVNRWRYFSTLTVAAHSLCQMEFSDLDLSSIDETTTYYFHVPFLAAPGKKFGAEEMAKLEVEFSSYSKTIDLSSLDKNIEPGKVYGLTTIDFTE